MKKEFKLCLFALIMFNVISCNPLVPENELINEEKIALDVVYKSLGNTPAQLADSILSKGFYEGEYSPQYRYHQFFSLDTKKNYNKSDLLVVEMMWDAKEHFEIIAVHRGGIQKMDNPVEYFKRVSDLVAKYGYTEWLGQHYIDDGKNKVTESYSDRKEFLSKMDLSSLKEMDTDEKFTETFIYTHDDNSKWKGTLYFNKDIQTGIYEGEHVLYMEYAFILEPIK